MIHGFWPTWRHIWNVLTKPLFFISGMFYTFESLPEKAQAVLWYNPLIHGVGLMRGGLYLGLRSPLRQPGLRVGIALGSFVVGAYLLRRHSSRLLER